MGKYYLYLLFAILALGCDKHHQVKEHPVYPPIYPDYTDITIPYNMAPLNFLIREEAQGIEVTCKGGLSEWTITGGRNTIQIPEKRWKTFLEAEKGNTIAVHVKAKISGRWLAYLPFTWTVAKEKIDPYLSYRLIEPGYEVWNKIQLCERNLENFNERVLIDNNQTDGMCMNCHIYGNQDPALSLFHIRGARGGTVVNRNGVLRKINTNTNRHLSPAIYGGFHPSGKYAVFSTNRVIPEFHAYKTKQLEVYDSASDVMVIDFDTNQTYTSGLLSSKENLETFPVFSANGTAIYFCSSPTVVLPDSIQQLQYNLCRISFDPSSATFGHQVDTLFHAVKQNQSVCHLKTSPDGRYILYTVADYGTFPIWHQETDLQMIDLLTGSIDTLGAVNSDKSDTYHSWSSNSHWFVFASKRDDGVYGKPYFAYIDSVGHAHKPFLLPQRDPAWYDYTLKSFNIPELSKGSTPFHAKDIERLYREDAEVLN